jgi:hypothetical protein
LTRDGYADIRDLANMREEDIDSLEYPDANDNPVTVPRYLKALIRIFKQYITYHNDISDPIGDGWTTIIAEQFDTYRTRNNYLVGHRPTGPQLHLQLQFLLLILHQVHVMLLVTWQKNY